MSTNKPSNSLAVLLTTCDVKCHENICEDSVLYRETEASMHSDKYCMINKPSHN